MTIRVGYILGYIQGNGLHQLRFMVISPSGVVRNAA